MDQTYQHCYTKRMSIIIFSCSLNPNSKSRTLASTIQTQLKGYGEKTTLIDLADVELPLCDGGRSYEHPNVAAITRHVESAKGIVFACPIYNYDVNSAAKTLIEHVGRAMTEKVVGFALAAGGHNSYMSIMPFANSLMLDFRCVVVPRFVYTTGQHFNDQNDLADDDIHIRIRNFSADMKRMSSALSKEPS